MANPNNPTGTIIKKKELLQLRKKLRSNILLVVDDAYYEYVKDKNYSSGIKLFSNSKKVKEHFQNLWFSRFKNWMGLRFKNLIYALNQ